MAGLCRNTGGLTDPGSAGKDKEQKVSSASHRWVLYSDAGYSSVGRACCALSSLGLSSDSHATAKPTKPPLNEGGLCHASSCLQSLHRAEPPSVMNEYLLQHTLQSLGGSVSVVEFSPNGRFLIVGEGQPARLQVLDRLAGFCPTIEADTISQPTSFVFESSATFLAGLDDGRFVVYSIDLRSKRLIKGWTNNVLRGPSSVAAIALNETSQILALAVGPSVFVFRRISETGETLSRVRALKLTSLLGEFQFTANISSYFDLESNPIKPPSPTSLCFSSNGQLHVAFCRQHVA